MRGSSQPPFFRNDSSQPDKERREVKLGTQSLMTKKSKLVSVIVITKRINKRKKGINISEYKRYKKASEAVETINYVFLLVE